MSVASISSSSSISAYQDFAAPTAPQASINSMVSQLEKSITDGNLDTTKTLLQSIEARMPTGSGSTGALSTFLTSVDKAVSSGSTSAAEEALVAYQDALAAPAKPSETKVEDQAVGAVLLKDEQTAMIIKMTVDTQNSSSSSSDTSATSSSSTGTLFSATA